MKNEIARPAKAISDTVAFSGKSLSVFDQNLITSGIIDKEIDIKNEKSPFIRIYKEFNSIESLIGLAHELVEWSQEPTSLVLGGFCAERGIIRRVFYKWLKRCRELREAWEYAKEVIGVRRELGCLNGDLNGLMIWRTMAMYDPDYKKMEEWRSKLKSLTDNAKIPSRIEITMPKWYLNKLEESNPAKEKKE